MLRVRKQVGCSDELVATCGEKGVTVALLDTGVCRHPDFGNRVIAFQDFLNNKEMPYDDCGHGTHVAGCLCGSGLISGGKYKGIAPLSKLVVGKVLNEKGEGMIENMVKGMEWVLDMQKALDIRVLNISVGMGETADKKRMEYLLWLMDEAWRCGMIVVCAAGNLGPKPMSVSPLGAGKWVITVGCHEGGYFGDKEFLCEKHSGRGPSEYVIKKPDVVAPGTNIVSCNSAFEIRGHYVKNGYIAKSGTSMATPIVSGAMALLLQKYPYYTNERAKQKLLYSAMDLKEPWCKQGWGMIRIDRLLK